ncbi:uncharacterized protein LOC127566380 [Drosophila albomicans]|uniref:Uncharacterized protein LOC127566380 n=1 Tax=Drosophila albomicans TaxID=7291 RepID=A0A9C6T4D3_DROAB|nr:uncharacterized protein LOC127566380 [Drosophila albomicans]
MRTKSELASELELEMTEKLTSGCLLPQGVQYNIFFGKFICQANFLHTSTIRITQRKTEEALTEECSTTIVVEMKTLNTSFKDSGKVKLQKSQNFTIHKQK